MKELNYKNLFVQTLLVCLLLFSLLVYMSNKYHKVSLKYETTQYQLEQLVEYLTHNGFLITELKQEDYNE